MPGKQCTGSSYNNAGHFRESRAYCEGISFRASGSAIGMPSTGNPHPFGSAANLSWALGWNTADAAAGSALPPIACCAATGIILV